MEIKTLEIEKFITLKFNIEDLRKIIDELYNINEMIDEQKKYNSIKYNHDKIKTLSNFKTIIEDKIIELNE